MIVEKTKPKTYWEEKITVELTLADLQLLYDCVGAVPWRYISLRHDKTIFKEKILLKNSSNLTCLYHELEKIVDKHNGLTDEDSFSNNLNLDVQLEIELED